MDIQIGPPLTLLARDGREDSDAPLLAAVLACDEQRTVLLPCSSKAPTNETSLYHASEVWTQTQR